MYRFALLIVKFLLLIGGTRTTSRLEITPTQVIRTMPISREPQLLVLLKRQHFRHRCVALAHAVMQIYLVL